MGKKLWSSGDDGEQILVYHASDELNEGRYVIERIKQWIDSGHPREEIAILYRSNVQSRIFEDRLFSESIPYRVYGGRRFFDRQEIRHALAYLRLMNNHDDDASFERIVNTPTRGIGERSIERVREVAKEKEISINLYWNRYGLQIN